MHSPLISEVLIIYNPKSTGAGQTLADAFKQALALAMPGLKVTVMATMHQGHAEELAAEYASRKGILLISASGDGGYNELINGIMKSTTDANRPLCAVLPAGNANDHHRELSSGHLLANIQKGLVRELDLLRVDYVARNGRPQTRYAHSYIGLGISSTVGDRLNQTTLNAVNEKIIAARSFLAASSVTIQHGAKLMEVDSIVFTNIGRMAKFWNVSQGSSPDDGLFEIQIVQHKSQWHKVAQFAKMTSKKTPLVRQASRYDFAVFERTLMQLDGEIVNVAGDTQVTVKTAHKALKTIL